MRRRCSPNGGATLGDEPARVNRAAGTIRRVVLLLGALFAWATAAGAQDPERIILGQVRLTMDGRVTTGCVRLGSVHDDSVKDLRRKIVRAGGNTGVLSFPIDDLSTIQAEVFRCPSTPPPQVVVPPPPAGAPPPPPPGPSR